MRDSVYQKIITISSKIESLSHKIDTLSTKSTFSLWTPIIAALITAIIGTLVAQAIDRIYKNRNELKKDLREIQSNAVNLKIKLKDLFRQLAMYKFHAGYWWHLHTKENDKEFSLKYYSEHLRSQSDARNIEKEIGQAKAEFLAEVVKFEKLKGIKFNVDFEKKAIENLTFIKARYYTDDISADKLREELAEGDEKELRESYFKNLQVFQNIINKMG